AIAHIEELFPSAFWAEIRAEAAALRNREAHMLKMKPFLEELLTSEEKLNPKLSLTKFVLDKKVRDVVNTYLGMRSKYYYYFLNLTHPIGEGDKAQKSQRWHRDPEDKKLCKIFLYLTDVDETAGPFTYISGSAYGMKYANLFPQKCPIGYYPRDGAVEPHIDPKDIRTLTGRSGTIIFCDTAGLHKGGYATQKERLMFTGGYLSLASVIPLGVRYPKSDLYELSPAPEMRLSKKLFHMHQRLSKYLDIDPYND
ncbi:MAG: phytanoyl-CoA dioxygenase family protein, partial [Candidatus Sungbacteria bacterium]|nr:phytanoyl-CoA dioxygenase family protein [Candidatus Sungbacteria bacterium]